MYHMRFVIQSIFEFLIDNDNYFTKSLYNINNHADLPCKEGNDEKKTITRIAEKNSCLTVYNLRRRLYESKDLN